MLDLPLTIEPRLRNVPAILLIVLTIPLWLAFYLVADLWKLATGPGGDGFDLADDWTQRPNREEYLMLGLFAFAVLGAVALIYVAVQVVL